MWNHNRVTWGKRLRTFHCDFFSMYLKLSTPDPLRSWKRVCGSCFGAMTWWRCKSKAGLHNLFAKKKHGINGLFCFSKRLTSKEKKRGNSGGTNWFEGGLRPSRAACRKPSVDVGCFHWEAVRLSGKNWMEPENLLEVTLKWKETWTELKRFTTSNRLCHGSVCY